MPEELNAALDLPYVFDITIKDVAVLWRKLEDRHFVLTAQSPSWYGKLQGEVGVSFGKLDGYLGPVVPKHGMEKTAVEAILATVLMQRIGIAIRELALEALQVAVVADGSGEEKGRLRYGENNLITGVDEQYLRKVLDPLEDYAGDGCLFEVLEYSLNSPFRMKSRIASMMLSLNLALLPLGGRPVDYNLILNALNTFIAAANLGYELTIVNRKSDHRLSLYVEQEFDKLMLESASGEVNLLQKYLAYLGFYHGELDNRFGPKSERAARNFARVFRIYDYKSHRDHEFLHTVARAYVHYRNITSSPSQ
ncbi:MULTISPECIES: peptidoglycan-binding domain-containing protein [unclassified Ensifer]|uniref:peptidoglycan-binding domain-containing protein n=1 Tax=unclassified Ensifer TaxID=2633371 RepID=UPI0008134436|nr:MULTISPECIES: peptidoglycan-binding domain-containing protein [unclassified Ensifer]